MQKDDNIQVSSTHIPKVRNMLKYSNQMNRIRSVSRKISAKKYYVMLYVSTKHLEFYCIESVES